MAQDKLSRWENPFWLNVRSGVVAGLILLAITGVGGLTIKLASDLSFGDVLLYIGAPALVVILLVVGFFVGRAAMRTVRGWQEWQTDVSSYVLDLVRQVRRQRLQEVIHTAQVWEWKVWEDEDNDLVFESPDGEVAYVRDMDAMPHAVAEHLHDTEPDHFPEKWVDFIADVGRDAIDAKNEADDAHKRLATLENRLEDVVRSNGSWRRDLVQVALGPIMADARQLGWQPQWYKDRVVFSRDRGGTTDEATITYNEPGAIDVGRLRAVLGIDPF